MHRFRFPYKNHRDIHIHTYTHIISHFFFVCPQTLDCLFQKHHFNNAMLCMWCPHGFVWPYDTYVIPLEHCVPVKLNVFNHSCYWKQISFVLFKIGVGCRQFVNSSHLALWCFFSVCSLPLFFPLVLCFTQNTHGKPPGYWTECSILAQCTFKCSKWP